MISGVPITRYWLIPAASRPKMFMPHPSMSSEELRSRTQGVWDRFYSLRAIWERSHCTPNIRARLAFLFVSKLYRQMYARTGIATDSARQSRARFWARLLAKPCRRLFQGRPMPELEVPVLIRQQTGVLEQSSTAAKRDEHRISLHVLD
jgi:hypothetical protein